MWTKVAISQKSPQRGKIYTEKETIYTYFYSWCNLRGNLIKCFCQHELSHHWLNELSPCVLPRPPAFLLELPGISKAWAAVCLHSHMWLFRLKVIIVWCLINCAVSKYYYFNPLAWWLKLCPSDNKSAIDSCIFPHGLKLLCLVWNLRSTFVFFVLLLLFLHRQLILYSFMPRLSTEGCRKVGNCLRIVQTHPASSSQPCPLISGLEIDGIHHLHCIHHVSPCSWTSLNSSVNCFTLLFMHFFTQMSFVSSGLDILLSAALL